MGGREFIADFQNLSGVTVGERRKNLQYLLQQYSNLKESPSDLELIANCLKPTTHLERIFRLDILINFRYFPALFEDYKNGDDTTIKKLSKQQWFTQRAFHITDPDEFVDDFLPKLSHIVRSKILKQIHTKTAAGYDEIFDKIAKRYGLFVATSLLHKCNETKIRGILNENSIKLTYKQLKTLFDKDPELIDLYLEKLERFDNDRKHFDRNPIFVYIAQKNPGYFCKLLDKHEFDVQLGGRTTKKFVISEKQRILTRPEDFAKILRKDALVKKLQGDFNKFFSDIFPRNLDNYDHIKYLQYYPKNARFHLYKTTFNSIFSEKFDDNLEFINENVLKLMRNKRERENYAQLKYEKDENDDYLKYYQTANCLKLLKDRLTSSKSSQRVRYIELLTHSCLIDEDLDALLVIGDLILTRFKNEEKPLCAKFCSIVFSKDEFVDRLTEQHWEMIYSISHLAQGGYMNVLYIIRMLQFYFDKTQKFDEILSKLGFEQCAFSVHEFQKLNNKPKLQKSLILGSLHLQLPSPNDDYNLRQICDFYIKIIQFCRTYNNNNRTDAIDIAAIVVKYGIVELIEVLLKKDHITFYHYDQSMLFVIFGIKKLDISKTLKQAYYKFLQCAAYGASNFLNLLKYDPQSFVDNFDQHINYLHLSSQINNRETWRIVKNYNYLDLDKKLIEYCLLYRNDMDKFHRYIKVLSMLMPPEAYVEFANNYKPDTDKVDLDNEEIRKKYRLQSQIIYELKNLKRYDLILPLTLQFCCGDYLKYALRSLYSCFYRMPENQILSSLKTIKNTPNISVRKHAIHLICCLSDTKTVHNHLKETPLPVLGDLLQYFIKNPDADLWALLQTKIIGVKATDTTTLELLAETLIPLQYRDDYCKLIWGILVKFNKNSPKKQLLLKLRTKNYDLCRQICEDFVDIAEIDGFLVDFVMENRSSSTINLMGQILNKFKTDYWNDKERNARKRIRNFILLLYTNYQQSKRTTDAAYFVDFLQKFGEIFHIYEVFNEFVLLKLMLLKGKSIDCIAKEILDLKHDLSSHFGDRALCLFVGILRRSLTIFFKKHDDAFQFYYHLFENRKYLQDLILIIRLLPKLSALTISNVESYNKIMEVLQKCDDDSVKLYLNLYFCN